MRFAAVLAFAIGLGASAFGAEMVMPAPGPVISSYPDTDDGTGRESPVFEFRSLGDAAMRNGFYDEAARYYERYREAARVWPALETEAILSLADAKLSARRTSEADELLQILRNRNLKGAVRAELLEARVALEQKRLSDAFSRIVPLADSPKLDTALRIEALMVLIAVRQEEGDWAAASTGCRTLLSLAQDGGKPFVEWIHFAVNRQIYFDIRRGAYVNAAALLRTQTLRNNQERCEHDLLNAFLFCSTGQLFHAAERYRQARSLGEFQLSPLATGIGCEIAEKFVGAGRIQEGIGIFKDAFDTADNREIRRSILRRIATIQREAGLREEAVATLSRYQRYYPDAPDIVPLSVESAELQIELKDRQGAFAAMDRLLAHSSMDSEVKLDVVRRYARMLMGAEQYDEARTQLREVFELTLDEGYRGEAMYLMAQSMVKQRRYSQALSIFSELAKNPQWREQALYRKMIVESELNLVEEALATTRKIMADCKDSAIRRDAEFFHAHILARGGLKDEAEKAFQIFIDSSLDHPRLPDAMLELGELYLQKGKYTEAAAKLTALLKRFPDNPNAPRAQYQKIFADSLSGDEAAAVNAARIFPERWPQSPYAMEALFWLSDYYLSDADYPSAETVLNKVIHLSPDTAPTLFRARLEKVNVLRRANRPDSALEELDLLPKSKSLRYRQDAAFMRGDILSVKNRYAEAAAAYENAAEIAPQSLLGIAACGRVGDCRMALFSADAEFNEKELLNARAAYEKILASGSIPRETEEQVYWKIGHTYHLMQKDNQAMLMFMRPILRRQREGNGAAASNVWLAKSGQSILRILRKQETPEASSKAVQVCQIMITLGVEPKTFWQETIHAIQSGSSVPSTRIHATELLSDSDSDSSLKER